MKKHSYKFIKEQIENPGYKLLSDEYKNNISKLKVECPEGHQYKVTYGNFIQHHRCPICYNKIRSNKRRLTYSFVKNQIEKEGYKLLSNEYKDNNTKLKIQCSEKHEYEVRYGDFQQGKRCPICAYKNCSNRLKLLYKHVKCQIEKEGYKLLSNEYKDNNTKLKIQCAEGHIYKVIYSNFQKGRRCPICWDLTNYSRAEKECLDIVKQLTNENIIENDRTQIVNPKTNRFLELDMWIPSLKKAIEFNGECWHKHRKFEDNQKVKQCKEKDINLMVINYQNWIDNREEQIQNLKEFIK